MVDPFQEVKRKMTSRSDDTKVSLFGGWLTIKFSKDDLKVVELIRRVIRKL